MSARKSQQATTNLHSNFRKIKNEAEKRNVKLILNIAVIKLLDFMRSQKVE